MRKYRHLDDAGCARRHAPSSLLNMTLCRREPIFSAVFRSFSQPPFMKSGVICPLHPARIADGGKFCRAGRAARKRLPGPIFLTAAKSMFNQVLRRTGMALANGYAGKTPKEHCSMTRTGDQHVL